MPQPPRDATEIELSRIWQAVLREPVADIDLNFFLDLGGTSRAGVQLVVEIRRRFGVDLRLAELLSAPTVRMLADWLAGAGAGKHTSPVVLLQKGEEKAPPLYLFHALPGTLVKYFELGRALGPRHTLLGLQSLGIEQDTSPLDSMEEMADAYVSHMLDEHPGGPWRLLGYSMGGYLAVEAARRLRDHGEAVDLVCVLDSRLPASAGATTDPDVMRTLTIQGLARTMLNLEIAQEDLRGRPYRRQIDVVVERGHLSGAFTDDHHVCRFLRFLDVRIRNHLAILRYEPAECYLGTLTLIRASDVPAYEDDGRNGWSGAAEAIEVFDTPGDHLSMVEAPAVHRLAEIVEGRLRGGGGPPA